MFNVYIDILFQIFQQVEEESERRAQDEHEREKAAGVADKSATEKRHKDRRRGSVSISRIGKVSYFSHSGVLLSHCLSSPVTMTWQNHIHHLPPLVLESLQRVPFSIRRK